MKLQPSLESRIVPLLDRLLRVTHLNLSYTIEADSAALPELIVRFSGPDAPMLLGRNAELLQAIEHLSVRVCGLEPAEHDRVVMDANEFKVRRDAALLASAARAAVRVRETGQPFTFSPMSSHERRRLHLALSGSGFQTESTGTGAHRAVVLYPPPKPQAQG